MIKSAVPVSPTPISLDRREFVTALGLASLAPFMPSLPLFGGDKSSLRVASLDWALAETMLALNHKPVAMVDAASWNRFVVEPPLPPGIADIGLSTEINFELLAALKPDLILTSPFVQELEPALRRIAETMEISVFEQSTMPFAQQKMLTHVLGERLGRNEAAEALLSAAEQQFDSYRQRISALHPLPVLLVNFMDGRHVRVYGGSGLYQNVLQRIGVVNAWTGERTIGATRLWASKS